MTTCPNCKHEFDTTNSNPDITVPNNMRGELFDTFLGLADSVLAHVRATGARVISSDNPWARRIGFETVQLEGPHARRWEISLTNAKTSAPEDSRLGIYRTYLSWAEARNLLASMWSERREPTEAFKKDDK